MRKEALKGCLTNAPKLVWMLLKPSTWRPERHPAHTVIEAVNGIVPDETMKEWPYHVCDLSLCRGKLIVLESPRLAERTVGLRTMVCCSFDPPGIPGRDVVNVSLTPNGKLLRRFEVSDDGLMHIFTWDEPWRQLAAVAPQIGEDGTPVYVFSVNVRQRGALRPTVLHQQATAEFLRQFRCKSHDTYWTLSKHE